MSNEKTYDVQLFGDSQVGKSCLVLRAVNNIFREEQIRTIGTDFLTKKIQGIEDIEGNKYDTTLRIFDPAAQAMFRNAGREPGHTSNPKVAILCYDVTDANAIQNLMTWITESERTIPSGTPKILVGLKSDLLDNRAIEKDIIEDFAENNNMEVYEVSAKTGINVEKFFRNVAEIILQNQYRNSYLDKNNNPVKAEIKRTNNRVGRPLSIEEQNAANSIAVIKRGFKPNADNMFSQLPELILKNILDFFIHGHFRKDQELVKHLTKLAEMPIIVSPKEPTESVKSDKKALKLAEKEQKKQHKSETKSTKEDLFGKIKETEKLIKGEFGAGKKSKEFEQIKELSKELKKAENLPDTAKKIEALKAQAERQHRYGKNLTKEAKSAELVVEILTERDLVSKDTHTNFVEALANAKQASKTHDAEQFKAASKELSNTLSNVYKPLFQEGDDRSVNTAIKEIKNLDGSDISKRNIQNIFEKNKVIESEPQKPAKKSRNVEAKGHQGHAEKRDKGPKFQ